MALTGSVKSFNAEKGFGFITGEDGTDIFVHIKACVDGGVPQTGDVLAYDSEPSKSKPGQMTAVNVVGGTGVAGAGGKGGGKGGAPTGTGTMQGNCKAFIAEKGFGFITAADGTDVFLHVRAMVDGTTPQQGDYLSYDMEESPIKPGQMQATNVTGGTGWGPTGKACGGKATGYGQSKGDPWGMPQGGKGSPYGGSPYGGGGKGGGWGGAESWGAAPAGGDAWSAGGGGGAAWGGGGGDAWGAAGGW